VADLIDTNILVTASTADPCSSSCMGIRARLAEDTLHPHQAIIELVAP
jgi:hypothetical protein